MRNNNHMAKNAVTGAERRGIGFALMMVVTGLVGWFASFELLTEYLKTLENSEYDPNCNISVLVTCGPNMASDQGSLFGFPNPILGVSAFIIPIVLGVAILAGSRFPVWFWRLYQVGLLLGYIFVCWLQYQSIFNIHTLCPWCMVVWVIMIPLWWWSLARQMAVGHLGTSNRVKRAGKALLQWTWVIVVINYILVAAVSQFELNWLFTEFGIGSF